MEYLSYQTSTISWCEDKFVYSPYIAEFYNSISNIFYIFIYYFGLYSVKQIFCKDYDKKLFGMLLFTGGCSFYFHATLSLLGQIMDELSILFVLSQSLLLLYKNNNFIVYSIYILTFIFTIIMCFIPELNIPILFSFGMFMWRNIEHKLVISQKNKIVLWYHTKVLFFISLVCWFTDKFLCDVWPVSELYLHAWWHLLIGMTAYYAIFIGLYIEYGIYSHKIDYKYNLLPVLKHT